MEHWEQHFVEKSRRRFEKERLERRRGRTRMTIAVAAGGTLLIGAVVGLAFLA